MKPEIYVTPEELLMLRCCDKYNSLFRTSDSLMTGSCYSGQKGSGSDLYGIRKFADGDNFRRINRKVTARTGVLHLNEYLEERLLSAFVVIDQSSYMFFSSTLRMKSVKAAKCGIQIISDYFNNDHRVGGEVFNEKGSRFLPLGVNEANMTEWIGSVAEYSKMLMQDQSAREVIEPLHTVLDNLIHRGVSQTDLYIISDFLIADTDEVIGRLEVLLSCNKLHLIQVTDLVENNPPRGQMFTNGFSEFLFSNRKTQQAYMHSREERRNKLIRFSEQNNIQFVETYT